jgi:hypothetical protein
MKVATLARAIERDLLTPDKPRLEAAKCFACGRAYAPISEEQAQKLTAETVLCAQPLGGWPDGRFCSTRCREVFDAGLGHGMNRSRRKPLVGRHRLLTGGCLLVLPKSAAILISRSLMPVTEFALGWRSGKSAKTLEFEQ